MSRPKCRECGKEVSGNLRNCPHCDTPVNPNIPKYPTFGGSGWIMTVIGILFITLIVGLLINMFVYQD